MTLDYLTSIEEKLKSTATRSNKPGRNAIIRSVFRPSAQGRHKRTLHNGQLAEQNRAIGAAVHFSPSLSISRRQLNTGFWETVENPYKAKSYEQSELPTIWKDREIWKREKITIQEYLEIKYGKDPGFFTSQPADLWGQRKSTKPTYLQGFRYPLQDGATVLNLDTERDEIMYLLALKSPKIANSAADVNTLKHTHYISKVNEGEMAKAKKTEMYEDAIYRLHKIKNEYDSETVKRFAINLNLVKDDDVAPRSLKNKLSDYLNDKQYKEENIKTFFDLYDMFEGNENEKYKFETMYLVKTLVNKRIISQGKGSYTWGNAPDQSVQKLGISEASVIEFLMDPEANEWREKLCEELKSKTGIVLQ